MNRLDQSPPRISLAILALSACILIGSNTVLAAIGVAKPLTAMDMADLHRIEAYLDGVKTLKAKFEQYNPDGGTATGDVYLSRPGRMRFEYAPPVKMDIVSNGDYVAVDDKELKQVNFLPVASTPVWFLLKEGIKLSGDVTVTKVERDAGTIRITAVQTKDPGSGSITLVFSDRPLQLVKWTILDGQGKMTTVVLEDPVPGISLDPTLFRLPNPPATGARAR